MAISSLLCGANSWEDMALYGREKLGRLRSFLPYEHGYPCKDTLRRFFRQLDSEQFQAVFVGWMQSVHPVLAEQVVAIDGKTARHSFDSDEKSAFHMVSAFAAEARLVLGQQAVDEKSNEIVAIPKLLDMLALDGAIVTIDAMGCQHKIADKILLKEGHYVLALKGNQGTLHDNIKTFFDDGTLKKAGKFTTQTDAGHGRIETRTCTVTDDIQWLKDRHPLWQSIHSIVAIDSIVELENATVTETRFYITSLPPEPEKLLHAIRSHWAIENSLHWSLDMTFNNDYNRSRKDDAPANIMILQQNKPKRASITGLRKTLG